MLCMLEADGLPDLPWLFATTGNKAKPMYANVIITIVIKTGPVLRPVPFRRRGKNLLEGNRGPGLYSRKYGSYMQSYNRI